ncbi:RHS repeat domain-containing protein [Dysgonomonas sp. 25]|uniref:RHS repeat domain-containing protein n=1 Tax=Dysgonomonas sp. 25 TaxID=2302933 RepID=UPI0021053357|nr:RHS repeat-associated core domain-containing protein [Dysgonomonas sp. 25]
MKRILINGGYIENNQYNYYIQDHLGNNRAVATSNGTVIRQNHYYPFGASFADGLNKDKDAYKYNGKEQDRMHGLDWYDYAARHMSPAVPRFTTVDPLAEKYYSISPYAYCANNPIKFIDPTGMAPVYNEKGELIGTTEDGLQGDAIFMNSKNFTQGMSNKDASKHNIGIDALGEKARESYQTSFDGLKDRPDYDGYLTPKEAEAWYREGGGQPLYVDVSKINLGGAWASYFKIGEEKGYNFFLMSPKNYDTARVYGTLAITLLDDNGTASIVPSRYRDSGQIDDYNFDQHPGQPLRNLQTRAASKYAGAGTGYNIYGYGTAKLSTDKWYNPLRILSPY